MPAELYRVHPPEIVAQCWKSRITFYFHFIVCPGHSLQRCAQWRGTTISQQEFIISSFVLRLRSSTLQARLFLEQCSRGIWRNLIFSVQDIGFLVT